MSVHKYFLPPTKPGGPQRVRWRVNYDLPPDPETGKRRRGTKQGFVTKREAREWEDGLRGGLVAGTPPPSTGGRVTVAQYLRSWYQGVAGKQTTRAHYRDMCEWYLIPHLGGYPLARMDELDAPDLIDQMYRILEQGGWKRTTTKRTAMVGPVAPKTVRHAHTVLHRALATAVERKRLHRNPASLAHPPSTKSTKSRSAERVWNEEQIRVWLKWLADRGDRLYGIWYLAATTGMRRGELAGLHWSLIDLDAATVKVRWELTEVDNEAVWVDGAKTPKGVRTVDLDAATVAVLRAHHARSSREKLACGPDYLQVCPCPAGHPHDLVVCWPDGGQMHPGVLLKALRRHADVLGFPRITVHGLRHSYATIALDDGVDPKVVAERLGHDVSVTLGTYDHVTARRHREAAERIAKRITG